MSPGTGWPRGGLYRRWKWNQERHLALVLQPRAALTAPAAAVVTVVANSPTLIATAPPSLPLAKLHGQQAERWRLFMRARQSWRTQPVTVAGMHVPLTSAQVLTPGSATVTVAAQAPTLVQGNPPYQPRRRVDEAVRWAWERPGARPGSYRLQVAVVVPINPPFAPGVATVTVVANDAQVFQGAALYFPMRMPLAARWAEFVKVGRPQTTRQLPPPAPPQTLAPSVAVVTVVGNTATLLTGPTPPDPGLRLRKRDLARYWEAYRDPWPQVAGRSTQPVFLSTALIPDVAIVSVVANDATISGVAQTLTPGVATVTVVANSPTLVRAPDPTVLTKLHGQQAARWHLWRQQDRPQLRRLRAPLLGGAAGGAQFLNPGVATVTVTGNDATLTGGGVTLAPPTAVVNVVAQAPTLAASIALVPSVGVVTVVANSPSVTVSAVALTPDVAIVTVFATTSTLVGGAPVTTPVTARRWWRRYYHFAGGGPQ